MPITIAVTPISPYLATLRRVPDDIILAVATRDINLSDSSSCVCGWVVREAVARILDTDGDGVTIWDYEMSEVTECAERFGGTHSDWQNIYFGVTDERLPEIELAFVQRVAEAVRS